MSLVITHSCGFFSCCSVRLCKIINYFNVNKKLPDNIDSSQQYQMYKYSNKDITFDFFKHYSNDNIINYENDITIDDSCFQFDNYKTINFKNILPFVKKYFEPSERITNIYNNLIVKYNIDTDNCIGLYYRGTDKKDETTLDTFDSFYYKLNEIIITSNNDKIQILIQTDSAYFLEYMKEKCKDKHIIIITELAVSRLDRGIHYDRCPSLNYIEIQSFMATLLILSKCKYLICSSGNCSIWTLFFRENTDNVYQSLNRTWL